MNSYNKESFHDDYNGNDHDDDENDDDDNDGDDNDEEVMMLKDTLANIGDVGVAALLCRRLPRL